LPTGHLAMNNVSTQYKNGVLQITIPKKKGLREKDTANLKAV
jgi:HSP20 family molecular chaperone IbpA